jgi:hypothetical protein
MGTGPVVEDDIVGKAQEPPQPEGNPVQGYSGTINQNLLAPVAPDKADQPGYSSESADDGNPHHKAMVFRARVQANLAVRKQAADLGAQMRNHLYRAHNEWQRGERSTRSMSMRELAEQMWPHGGADAGPRDMERTLRDMATSGQIEEAPEFGEWQVHAMRTAGSAAA